MTARRGARGGGHALRGRVRIYTGEAGAPRASALAVRGGRIAAVGETRELRDAVSGVCAQSRSTAGRSSPRSPTATSTSRGSACRSGRWICAAPGRCARPRSRAGEAARTAPPGRVDPGRRLGQESVARGAVPAAGRPRSGDRRASRGAAQQRRPHGLGELRGARAGRDHARDPGSRGRHDRPRSQDGRAHGPLGGAGDVSGARARRTPLPGRARAGDRGRLRDVLHRAGVAGVHVVEGGDVLAAFQRLRARGALGLRVCMMLPEDALDAAITLGVRSGFGDAHPPAWAASRSSPTARSARRPRACSSRTRASRRTAASSSAPASSCTTLVGAGRGARASPSVVHAIGDRANRWVLDAIEAARADFVRWSASGIGSSTSSCCILTICRASRALGVVASMQPIHCTQDRDIVRPLLGRAEPVRLRVPLAARARDPPHVWLRRAGRNAGRARGDLRGGDAQRRRTSPTGRRGIPRSASRSREAVGAYTEGPAYAAGEERIRGSSCPATSPTSSRCPPTRSRGPRRAAGDAGGDDGGRRSGALLGLRRGRAALVRVVVGVVEELEHVLRLRPSSVAVLALDAGFLLIAALGALVDDDLADARPP